MLTDQQASNLYTTLCIASGKRNPASLRFLYMEHPADSVLSCSTNTLARIMEDPTVEDTLRQLIEEALETGTTKELANWCDINIGPNVVNSMTRDGMLMIAMNVLQSYCGGEIQKRGI